MFVVLSTDHWDRAPSGPDQARSTQGAPFGLESRSAALPAVRDLDLPGMWSGHHPRGCGCGGQFSLSFSDGGNDIGDHRGHRGPGGYFSRCGRNARGNF